MFKIAAALLASMLCSFDVFAADADVSCTLLERAELQQLGVTDTTPFRDSDTAWASSPQEIPDSHIVSNFCTVDFMTAAGRGAVILAVDRVEGKVTKEQVGDWLKAVDARLGTDTGAVVSKLGNTTCEAGQYDLPTIMDDGSIKDINEHYVACDTQVGTRHVSLNIHVPGQNGVPTIAQTKAILDKSIERLEYRASGLRI